jgi:hypothetical protein
MREGAMREGVRKKGGDGMDPEERASGSRNEEYNLVSVLYHALHGAETCEMYALDAEAAGDDELASFFRNVQATHRQVAEQAKTRLYTGNVAMASTAEVGTSLQPEVEREPPPPGPPADTNPLA